jgi:hypothetical protein
MPAHDIHIIFTHLLSFLLLVAVDSIFERIVTLLTRPTRVESFLQPRLL